ncbi:type 1 glutamine amidotransferase domain-containing protein [Marinomonas sp. 15G1-11]|uniref:Type 1 glutamine amidotransferase domain-containing protein n=1 Tax=Marinomonas phaeophyticola TaxID=3004091 RepID=A0ABT4JUZ8_9GAMM|nr:type 1 glutamine amidotransferase domain-containing protein [Marinomonas sp. 15G1-11]MCZ2722214.1 type 1 glutamine amidotransferase domain-containing protein [Marinomonas sp. 15G1-11]
MFKIITSLRKCVLVILFASISSFSAAAEKTILMLVTGASSMTNGKPTGLWLEEFAVPYKTFIDAGYSIKVVTSNGGVVPIDPRSNPKPEQAIAWKDASERLQDTKPLSTVNAEDFAAIFIPGGHGVMFDLANDPAAAKLIQEFDTQGKFIAAVCHGPAALVNVVRKDGSLLVSGRKMTSFTDAEERAVRLDKDMPFLLETRLRELGAKIETRDNFTIHAIRDGNLITGQNPPSSGATAELMIKALSE